MKQTVLEQRIADIAHFDLVVGVQKLPTIRKAPNFGSIYQSTIPIALYKHDGNRFILSLKGFIIGVRFDVGAVSNKSQYFQQPFEESVL